MMRAQLQDLISEIRGAGACRIPLHPGDPYHRYPLSGLLIHFGMGNYSLDSEDASNCYIRVSKNHDYEFDIRAYTHNLCGNDTYCLYFSDGKIFTTWIDFNSSAQTLEVRLANGSNPSVKKPLQPLLRISNYKMAEMLGDEVILTFWGSSDVQRVEAHELLSWEFFSTEISEAHSSQIPKQFWKARLWVGISTGVLGSVVAAAAVIGRCASRFASPSKIYRYTPLGQSARPHVFSFVELRMATDNFDERNLLGIGGSGSVYKGSFEAPNGNHLVAVKQINSSESEKAESLLHAEVATLGQIRHRNEVQLQGWCQESGRCSWFTTSCPMEPSINGFTPVLAMTSNTKRLSSLLERHHSILQGVGVALEYLHKDCLSCVLHQDIKSNNVLLNVNFKAHLGTLDPSA